MMNKYKINKFVSLIDASPLFSRWRFTDMIPTVFFRYLPALLFFMFFMSPTPVLAGVRGAARSFISFSPDNPYLPFLGLAGLMLGIATFYLPRFGLVVMLFFMLVATDMPIGRNAGETRPVHIRIEDLILVAVSLGWMLNRARTRNLLLMKQSPLYFAIILMSTAIIIATLVGFLQGTVGFGQGFLFSMKRLEYFWLFFMTYNLMETDKEAKFAIYLLLGCSLIMGFLGIVQYFLFPISQLVKGGATTTAGMGRANTMGDFLLLMIGVGLGFLVYAKGRRNYLLSLGFFLVLGGSLLLTKSRGAYVSVPPLLAVITFFSKSKRIIVVGVSAAVVVILYIAVTTIDFGFISKLINKHHKDISSQFTSIAAVSTKGTSADPSMLSRMQAWENSIDQIIEYPLVGQGCGAKKLGYADCHYVRELLETGIIGFCAFLYMNFMIFLFLYRYFLMTRDTFTKSLCLGFMGGHVGMLTHSVTMSNFYTIFNMEVFWFLLALISVLFYNDLQKMELNQEKPLPDPVSDSDEMALPAFPARPLGS